MTDFTGADDSLHGPADIFRTKLASGSIATLKRSNRVARVVLKLLVWIARDIVKVLASIPEALGQAFQLPSVGPSAEGDRDRL